MASLIFLLLVSCLLVWLAWQDYRAMILPNWANFLLLILGGAYHILIKQNTLLTLQEMILGATLGGGILFFSWLGFRWLKKVDGLGMGDIKFCLAAGVWLGPDYTAQMLFLSSLILLVIGGGYAIYTGRSLQGLKLPFGVTLAPVTAVLIWYYFGWQDMLLFL